MQVTICVRRAIIIDHDINTFNINASAKDVSSNEDSLFERLERSIPINAYHHPQPQKQSEIGDHTVPPVAVRSGC